MLIPRRAVPALSLETLRHGRFDLAAEKPSNFTLVVVYRGLHCPICAKYLIELVRLAPEYANRGVGILVTSTDDAARTAEMEKKIDGASLRFAHGLSLAKAREWGLYISASRGKTSIGIEEPALFAEPGVFLVRPDGTLYYGAVQTMPFARPHFDDLLQAIDFAIQKDYPARGEFTGAV